MKNVYIKRICILWILCCIVLLLKISLNTVEKRSRGKQNLVMLMEKIVRFTTIEMIPSYDYNIHQNEELLYIASKSIMYHVFIPYFQFRENYGNQSVLTLKEIEVPDSFYQEREESGVTKVADMKKKRTFSEKQLYNRSYLRKYFIQVDSTTTITDQELNGKVLFQKDLKLAKSKSPQILIYHTHGSENYADSKKGRQGDTVVGVGDELVKHLEKSGFTVLHDKTSYDVRNGKLDRSKAYYYAARGIETNLKKYPQIQLILDLHRDGVGAHTKLVTNVDGKKTAQIMFFNGMSRTATNGNISYLYNPNKIWNVALSMQLQKAAYERYPGFTRKVYIKGYRYNLHYRKRSMLVEVGAQTNTVAEAKASMKLLSELMASVLK